MGLMQGLYLIAYGVPKILMCITFTYSHEHGTNINMIILHCHAIILCSNLIRSLGKAGEIEGETEAILLENNIDFRDFSKEIIDSLPQLPWSIPKVANPGSHKMYN